MKKIERLTSEQLAALRCVASLSRDGGATEPLIGEAVGNRKKGKAICRDLYKMGLVSRVADSYLLSGRGRKAMEEALSGGMNPEQEAGWRAYLSNSGLADVAGQHEVARNAFLAGWKSGREQLRPMAEVWASSGAGETGEAAGDITRYVPDWNAGRRGCGRVLIEMIESYS